ncbi:hypothetical protein VTN77DRAFT_4696 [Rasamsonia byssochlamydoides]|uniref:uncharacterized protein n=1 Tax=Rasamsonia byssochlamydoides TaxID=89139 RepID=UPI0037440A25
MRLNTGLYCPNSLEKATAHYELAAASSATKNAWSCAFRMAFLSTISFDRGDKNAKVVDSLEIGEK